jgi:hypothetical protein
MDPRRALALFCIVPLLLFAGCGGGDDDGGGGDDADARPGPGPPDPAAGAEEDAATATTPPDGGRTSSASGFALTEDISTCMEEAGFTQDAPPTGGLAAWRHASGGRVVVGSGPDVTVGIASEIGTAERPANVEGSIVIAANEADSDAARACLDPEG